MLGKMGHVVEMVEDGTRAVAMLAQGFFDLVLMDVEMPSMDGLQATRLVRASGNEFPIVALTSQAMKGDRERCLAAGMNGYLSKPIRRVDLWHTVADLAGRRAAANPPAPAGGQAEQVVVLSPVFDPVKAAGAAGDARELERAATAWSGRCSVLRPIRPRRAPGRLKRWPGPMICPERWRSSVGWREICKLCRADCVMRFGPERRSAAQGDVADDVGARLYRPVGQVQRLVSGPQDLRTFEADHAGGGDTSTDRDGGRPDRSG